MSVLCYIASTVIIAVAVAVIIWFISRFGLDHVALVVLAGVLFVWFSLTVPIVGPLCR